jgi:hypothetical protein
VFFKLDVKSAFDKLSREKAFEIFRKEVGNYRFLDVYKGIMDKLLLTVDLGFATVKNVRNRNGMAQGLKLSCFM